MKRNRALSFSLLLFFFSGFVFSQSPVPAVSGIYAEVRNNLIRLTWIDSPEARGPVFVYRSETPFNGNAPAPSIRPVQVPYGAQSYIDEVESLGTWHYLVAASDAGGRQYPQAVSALNTISVSVRDMTEPAPVPAEAPAAGPAPADTAISSIEALIEGDAVIVSYQTRDTAKNAVLYRSVRPMERMADLLNAVIVQSGISSPFVDYPVPGIPYYYAVVFGEDISSGTAALFPGYNTTRTAVEVPPGKYRIGLPEPQTGIRSMPLPLISLYTAVPGAEGLAETPPPAPLSPEAAKAIGSIRTVQRRTPEPVRKKRAFDQDLETPAGGEEYPLRSIVQDSFAKGDWKSSIEELHRYLSLPRSRTSEARARFYLGQAYYFSGAPREALFEFLFVQSYYPEEAREWVQASLAALVKSGK
ncbi:MAG: hypothetical protein LBP93_08705 [Treponema sp.]|jgi:hypothetical protein|nr:hypothetical protein [Treponema sp.]